MQNRKWKFSLIFFFISLSCSLIFLAFTWCEWALKSSFHSSSGIAHSVRVPVYTGASMWIKLAQSPCWPPRSQQVLHQRWIHCTQAMKHARQGSTLALKPRGDVTRNPKHGYQWPQERTDVLQKRILKTVCLTADFFITSIYLESFCEGLSILVKFANLSIMSQSIWKFNFNSLVSTNFLKIIPTCRLGDYSHELVSQQSFGIWCCSDITLKYVQKIKGTANKNWFITVLFWNV